MLVTHKLLIMSMQVKSSRITKTLAMLFILIDASPSVRMSWCAAQDHLISSHKRDLTINPRIIWELVGVSLDKRPIKELKLMVLRLNQKIRLSHMDYTKSQRKLECITKIIQDMLWHQVPSLTLMYLRKVHRTLFAKCNRINLRSHTRLTRRRQLSQMPMKSTLKLLNIPKTSVTRSTQSKTYSRGRNNSFQR